MVNSRVGQSGVGDERSLTAGIREDLPAEAFALHPWRLLLGIPPVAAIAAGSVALVMVPLPWLVAVPGALFIGALYASLFFFGHEVGHGAVVRSRRVKEAVLYVTCLVYGLSPHLWMVWHNHAHHGHTNLPDEDPDTFGTLEAFRSRPLSRALARFVPGSGHWLSALYLPTFFTLQAHGVLWFYSTGAAFRRFNRRRAILDTAAMTAFWIAVGVWAGPRGALLAVVLPMIGCNLVMMSYVVTNHMLRPLADDTDSLDTTMSVSTFKVLDLLFLNFSHHVEHHLFPSMSPRYYPLVRQSLLRRVPGRYLAPSHWRAVVMVFRTPRLYADAGTLVHPATGRRVPLTAVEAAVRGGRLTPDPAVSGSAP